MKIVTIGRGMIGGGLASLWRAAGHEVEELGRDGGDASDADVVLVAVPGDKISAALSKVTGLEGKSRSTRRTSCPHVMATFRRTPRR
jgi:8-hydroxy-5-deazaflavin:NADPH oxidoreductase